MPTIEPDKVNEITVTTRGLMTALGCSRPSISNFLDQGMPRISQGLFNLVECFRWQVERAKENTNEIKLVLQDEQAKKARVERKIKEIELSDAKGESVDVSTVLRSQERIFRTLRDRILAIPAKVAPRLVAVENIAQVRDLLEGEVHECLEELSTTEYK